MDANKMELMVMSVITKDGSVIDNFENYVFQTRYYDSDIRAMKTAIKEQVFCEIENYIHEKKINDVFWREQEFYLNIPNDDQIAQMSSEQFYDFIKGRNDHETLALLAWALSDCRIDIQFTEH